MKTHYISWWNLENLFDTFDSENRPEWLAKELSGELKGWTKEVLEKKLENLSLVIKQINSNNGPDILGICEVESEFVIRKFIQKLDIPNRKYEVIHIHTNDKRGIDIAFIYDKNKYTFDGKIFHYEVMKRSATRDILQAGFTTKNNNRLILIGNHWPSRSGSQYKSEPYRMMAGETLSYWLKKIMEIHSDKAAVIVMGDFNDEPFNRSLREYALSTNNRKKVVYGKNPYLYNLMWKLYGEKKATYVFNSDLQIIDQFLVTKGLLLSSSVFSCDESSVRIEIFDKMVKGRYNTPIRFGRPSKKSSFNFDGFSDHLPISFIVKEK
ncbi:MAG: hypothetical protein JEY97_08840 [Bacteroidales bacterium]|nr:hypothetical protein [Bacteroidales bacterium]